MILVQGKARVEVDAAAAKVEAIALQENVRVQGESQFGRDKDGVLQPGRRVVELLSLTTGANMRDLKKNIRSFDRTRREGLGMIIQRI